MTTLLLYYYIAKTYYLPSILDLNFKPFDMKQLIISQGFLQRLKLIVTFGQQNSNDD